MTRSNDFDVMGARAPASSKDLLPEGSFDVAGPLGRAAAEIAMRAHPEIRTNFRSTLRDIVGPEFTRDEFDVLEDRALDAVEPQDLITLNGIYVGIPVDVTRRQKTTIDRLMHGLGHDALGQRARATYGEALRSGKIRVR